MNGALTHHNLLSSLPAPETTSPPNQSNAGLQRSPLNGLAFGLFIALTGCFFIRPTEVLGLDGWNLFEYLILACCVLSLRAWLGQCSLGHSAACPITALFFGLTLFIAISGLASPARDLSIVIAFLKFILYFTLLLGLIDSIERLQRFAVCLAMFIFILGFLPLLQYQDLINAVGIQPITDHAWDAAEGRSVPVLRLVGAGTFNDPNDLCQILSVGVLLGAYAAGTRRGILWRISWVLILASEGFAIALTRSRGGLIALICGLLTLFHGRFGWRKTALLLIPLLLCFMVLHGRQADLSTTSDTAQERVELWGSALILFGQHPFLGVGAENISEMVGHVAHNSFIQAYAELGFFGGATFLGLFAVSIWKLTPSSAPRDIDPKLAHLRVSLLAALVAYIAGMLSLTHIYELTPYLLVGMAVVSYRLASPQWMSHPWVTRRFILNLLLINAIFLVFSHFFVRLTYRN